ncbi:MAG TPA: cytochrome c biogenesis protein ResB [Myxococcales bacterium]|nr:cytochrome c biogenesis protein ResB [Myxococcales bacterium]
MVDRIFRAFCSLKLTLANLFAIFLAMVAGTFVNPGNAPLAEIEQAFASRPLALWSYRWFELYDLFHSWWFTLLLLSLALNLIACSIEKLPKIHLQSQYPEKRLDRAGDLRLKASGMPANDLVPELRRRGYAVEVSERDGGSDVFAERGRNSRYGVWVVHLSLLVILGGGIVGRLTAFEGTALVSQDGGEVESFTLRTPDGSTSRKRLGFTLRCTDFRLKQFESGAPKAYESDLVVLDGQGNELKRATINVNHPLQFGGLTIFQSSYQQLEEGLRARVRIVDSGSGASRVLLVAPGEKIEAAEGLTYSIVDHRADFAGLGEAVQVLREENGKPAGKFWSFAKAPEGFDARNRADRFAVSFAGTAQLYATGLQIARDPSTPIIYAGCFFLFAGCAIAFYTAHKRIWARVSSSGVAIGGAAHRNADAFRVEFEDICARIGLGAGRQGPARAA